MCCEAGLFGTVTLLVTIALGILLIMLRLSRRYAHRDSSLSSHTRRSFNAAQDKDGEDDY